MGFQDSRRLLPNVQWKLLEVIAENKQALSWESPKASLLMKKRKQLLSQQLRNYFQLDEDPFEIYVSEKAYKPKFTVLPE
jgi:hypothetical protein